MGVWVLLLAPAAPCAEVNLNELQRRLDAAKRERDKSQVMPQAMAPFAVAAVARPASVSASSAAPSTATVTLQSDADCRLSIDGRAHTSLEAGRLRTLRLPEGETRFTCTSVSDSDLFYTRSSRLEAGRKTTVQIELQDRIANARLRRNELAAASRPAVSTSPAVRTSADLESMPATQSWVYLHYSNSMATSLPGQVTLERVDGAHRLKYYGKNLDVCYRSTLDTEVQLTATTLTVTPKMLVPGCTRERLVINRDGSGGHRETRGAAGWRRDPSPRLLTTKT